MSAKTVKSITETMNSFVVDFFDHIESTCEERAFDWETIVHVKKEWEQWINEKKFDDLVKKEVKKVEKNAEKKAEKKTKPKKPKDAPKNARSGYILFSQDMRPVLKKEQPDLDAKDTLRALGAMWKEASEETKKKYQELAEEDKKRFKDEMENYVPSESDSEVTKKEKSKREKKPKDAPKNAKSGYMFYCAEIRAVVKEENPDMKPQEIMSEMGRRWKEIKDTEEAKKYLQLAEEDKERYAAEKKAYDEKNGVENETKESKKSKKTKDKKVNEEVEEDENVESENSKLVREIIESFGESEEVTFRKIKEKLSERDVEIEKNELKEIVNKIINE